MADWQRVKSIFSEVNELPTGSRSDALDRLCEGDAELRAAVESLLAAEEQAGDFLEVATVNPNETLPGVGDALSAVPSKIGTYAPLEIIGEGGFGTVYRAQQESPVRRVVALKVIKAGMDTREVITRFEGERQALAMMTHPNIAAVLDAGATAEGRPYFVMEYVPGDPITRYCDRNRLDIRDRLRLFMQVCHAVQHAHQKGIIHRDIKPGNVLVVSSEDATRTGSKLPSSFGAPAVAKVIDFGVAKATEHRLTENTLFTQEGVLVGTPEYMSPEQADPGRIDIDTRTDIYSLGVLLYELLTGTLPFSPKTLRSKGFAEIQRMVREVDPPTPSNRLSSIVRETDVGFSGEGSSADDIARYRSTDFRSLSRHVRGELDWIVMRCMEKDRSRRYETANSVALEVERFLNDEPIVAGPPGAGYRFGKFVRRNRTAILAVSGIMFALAIGLAIAVVGLVAARKARDVAERERTQAKREAGKAEAVNQFLQDMLAKADPKISAQREISVREAIDDAVERLDDGEMKEPEIEAAIRLTIGRTYVGLGRFEEAEPQIEKAAVAYRELLGDRSVEYADALHQRGGVRKFTGRPKEAEPDLSTALHIYRSKGESSADAAASCANDLALTLLDQQRFEDAEAILREVLGFARQPENESKPILAEVINNLGSIRLAQANVKLAAGETDAAVAAFREAQPYFKEALEINRRNVGEVHPNVATNLDNLAQSIHGQFVIAPAGKKARLAASAEKTYKEALAIRRILLGENHPDLATSLHNLSVFFYTQGDMDQAEKCLAEAYSILKASQGPTHPDTLVVSESIVSVLGASGKFAEAGRILHETFDAIIEDPDVPQIRKWAVADRLRQLYTAMQDSDQAATWTKRADELKVDGQ